jgi:hypothetical protein
MSRKAANILCWAISAAMLAGAAFAAWTWTWRGFTPVRLGEALFIPGWTVTLFLLFWVFGKRIMKRREAEGATSPASHFTYGVVVIVGMFGMLALMQWFIALSVAGWIDGGFEIAMRVTTLALGLFGVWLGNRRGKLETPWREGAREPFDWQKVQRLRGAVEVVMGFALAGLGLILPADLLLPAMLVSAVASAAATYLITRRVKQAARP